MASPISQRVANIMRDSPYPVFREHVAMPGADDVTEVLTSLEKEGTLDNLAQSFVGDTLSGHFGIARNDLVFDPANIVPSDGATPADLNFEVSKLPMVSDVLPWYAQGIDVNVDVTSQESALVAEFKIAAQMRVEFVGDPHMKEGLRVDHILEMDTVTRFNESPENPTVVATALGKEVYRSEAVLPREEMYASTGRLNAEEGLAAVQANMSEGVEAMALVEDDPLELKGPDPKNSLTCHPVLDFDNALCANQSENRGAAYVKAGGMVDADFEGDVRVTRQYTVPEQELGWYKEKYGHLEEGSIAEARIEGALVAHNKGASVSPEEQGVELYAGIKNVELSGDFNSLSGAFSVQTPEEVAAAKVAAEAEKAAYETQRAIEEQQSRDRLDAGWGKEARISLCLLNESEAQACEIKSGKFDEKEKVAIGHMTGEKPSDVSEFMAASNLARQVANDPVAQGKLDGFAERIQDGDKLSADELKQFQGGYNSTSFWNTDRDSTEKLTNSEIDVDGLIGPQSRTAAKEFEPTVVQADEAVLEEDRVVEQDSAPEAPSEVRGYAFEIGGMKFSLAEEEPAQEEKAPPPLPEQVVRFNPGPAA